MATVWLIHELEPHRVSPGVVLVDEVIVVNEVLNEGVVVFDRVPFPDQAEAFAVTGFEKADELFLGEIAVVLTGHGEKRNRVEARSGLRGVGDLIGERAFGRVKEIEVGVEAEAAVAFLAGGFFDEVHLFETGENFGGLGKGDAELVFDLVGGDGGLRKEIVKKRVGARHVSEGLGDLLVSAFAEDSYFSK